ncbi:uncharacterized protein METZ01_LOCUS373512, partial [marine metagenome]
MRVERFILNYPILPKPAWRWRRWQLEFDRIGHITKVKPVGTRCHTAKFPVSGVQNLPGPFRLRFPCTNRRQYPNDISNHMMEEPIGINIDPNPLPSPLNIQLIDHPNGLFGLTRRCPVGIKVVTTQKITTGRP